LSRIRLDNWASQVRKINAATALPAPDGTHLDGTHLDLELQVNALALIEIAATP
jgi:hypothetical protein